MLELYPLVIALSVFIGFNILGLMLRFLSAQDGTFREFINYFLSTVIIVELVTIVYLAIKAL